MKFTMFMLLLTQIIYILILYILQNYYDKLPEGPHFFWFVCFGKLKKACIRNSDYNKISLVKDLFTYTSPVFVKPLKNILKSHIYYIMIIRDFQKHQGDLTTLHPQNQSPFLSRYLKLLIADFVSFLYLYKITISKLEA